MQGGGSGALARVVGRAHCAPDARCTAAAAENFLCGFSSRLLRPRRFKRNSRHIRPMISEDPDNYVIITTRSRRRRTVCA